MSVLVHAMLVQALAGNAVIAKTPTDGGLSPASPWPARSPPARGSPSPWSAAAAANCPKPWCAPPRSAVSPSSAAATPAPASPPRSPTSANATSSNRRASTPGASGTTRDWDALTAVIPKLFDYGKQRCTAYPRFVVQRHAFADFLAAYLPAVRSIRLGPPPGRREPRRPAPRAGLRPADQRREGQGTDRPGRRGDRPRRRPAAPRLARRTAASCPARTPRAYVRPSPSWARRRPPRSTTPNPSARSTRSSWSTPRRNCSPR